MSVHLDQPRAETKKKISSGDQSSENPSLHRVEISTLGIVEGHLTSDITPATLSTAVLDYVYYVYDHCRYDQARYLQGIDRYL